MTDEERAKLEETHKLVQKINRALFEVPEGSPEDEKSLVEGARLMWRDYRRGAWAFRIVAWGIPTLAGIGAGFLVIKGWFVK